MPDSCQQPAPTRRWFRFRLRTLLVVMAVLTVVVGWGRWRMQRAQANRARVATIQGTLAWIEELRGGHNATTRTLRPQTLLEKWLDDPGGVEDPTVAIVVSHVGLGKTQITDAGLEFLKEMTKLETLSLIGTHVTDTGLQYLKGLTNLKWLGLNGTQITDTGIVHLTGLTNLEVLHLDDTQVTDSGLEQLKRLINLKRLNLDGTQVTDVGLEHLKGMTNLKLLWLFRTQVTDDGVNELRRALPNCSIHHCEWPRGVGHGPPAPAARTIDTTPVFTTSDSPPHRSATCD